jgi:hypothetical protein
MFKYLPLINNNMINNTRNQEAKYPRGGSVFSKASGIMFRRGNISDYNEMPWDICLTDCYIKSVRLYIEPKKEKFVIDGIVPSYSPAVGCMKSL